MTPPLLDGHRLKLEVRDLIRRTADSGAPTRPLIAAYLKELVKKARLSAKNDLIKSHNGLVCANQLSNMMDTIISVLHAVAVEDLFPADNPSTSERLSLVAVGGYGRATLAPFSDIDLLMLLPYKQTAWGENVAEYILYVLWDMGLKVGHATRTVDDCVRHAKADMTSRTAILESRLIAGDEALFLELMQRFDKDVVKNSAAEFVTAKLSERENRHLRSGSSRYLVEPNIKDGKGGLRDLNTLFWIGKYVYRVREASELVRHNVFSQSDYNRFQRAESFLWCVRCLMHFTAGRAEERLSFTLQPDIAQSLGYTPHAGLIAAERFMKHYFLIAKDVGYLTQIFCAALEEKHVKHTPMLNRMMGRFKRSRSGLQDAPDFLLDTHRLTVRDEQAFKREPRNIIRLFHLADQFNCDLHPDALKWLSHSLKSIDHTLRQDTLANRWLLDILTSPREPEKTLRKMNEAGVLGRFVPDFGRIVSMMQFNMYHHYTVDEHLIRSIGALSDLEQGRFQDEHPLAATLLPQLSKDSRQCLFVALFLHDIAKGRDEDHSLAGARIARSLCPRLGLSPAQTETVAWLVEHHLLMSTLAQSRDLADQTTIEEFAKVVQGLKRLRLLLLLTIADIRAVGPGVWNGWKGQLLRTLYHETETYLAGAPADGERIAQLDAAKDKLKATLPTWSQPELDAFLALHHSAYILRVDAHRQAAHAALIKSARDNGTDIATSVSSDAFRAVTEITIYAPDHPRLLAMIAGACAMAAANIVDAQIYTTVDGFALDTIFLSRQFLDEEDELRRAYRITRSIEQALRGDIQIPHEVAKKQAATVDKLHAFQVEPQVLVDNTWSQHSTLIEVSGLDRPGLLFDLTHALWRLNLNIVSAHIVTFGERAVDVFYVTDLAHAKITSKSRERMIKEKLTLALQGKPVR